MGLEPYLLAKVSELKNWEKAEQEDIVSCIECGSCQFTCPAYRQLLVDIRKGKQTVMGIIRSRTAPAPAAAPAKPAPAGDAPAKGATDKKAVVMNTAPKPFVTPTDVDFSGPKKNPVPAMPRGLKPAVMPKNWPSA
jgi:Na+-translocating ferredoxin:NAD+ oxidoreductase RnfC subunit